MGLLSFVSMVCSTKSVPCVEVFSVVRHCVRKSCNSSYCWGASSARSINAAAAWISSSAFVLNDQVCFRKSGTRLIAFQKSTPKTKE
uniref:Uncharacterized protein n=1 Tax=Panstrongylus lignarius TaxID=156445 RepID=A0A224XS31_9HEMI